MRPKPKIFIDEGHNPTGFWGTGAVGNGMTEQDIVWDVGNYLAQILRHDFNIRRSRPTRTTVLGTNNNTSVDERWRMSNSWGADYFISIHANAAGGTGAETFYFNANAHKFAETIQTHYYRALGLRNRRLAKTNQWAVLRMTNCPAILIELAFIDSPLHNPDVNILRHRRYQMAQAIAKGIYAYFGIQQSESSPSVDELQPPALTMINNHHTRLTRIQYQGEVNYIQAANIQNRYYTTIGELARIFGDTTIPLRQILELAGLEVDWDAKTRTIIAKEPQKTT